MNASSLAFEDGQFYSLNIVINRQGHLTMRASLFILSFTFGSLTKSDPEPEVLALLRNWYKRLTGVKSHILSFVLILFE